MLWSPGSASRSGRRSGPPPAIDFAPYRLPPGDLVLPLHPGPRHDWLTEQGKLDLFAQSYRVSPISNRIALRLSGQPLERRVGEELPSEGIVWGSVQLLNSGEILVFLADHPTTGGYPVIAVRRPLGRVGLRPGSTRHCCHPPASQGSQPRRLVTGRYGRGPCAQVGPEGSLWRLANRYRSAGPALPMALA